MRQRLKRVQVRLTNSEFDIFEKNVQRTGMSKEAYLRMLITNKIPKERGSCDEKILKNLYGIGNNLNQIARKANALSLLDVERYDENVEYFRYIMNEFLNK